MEFRKNDVPGIRVTVQGLVLGSMLGFEIRAWGLELGEEVRFFGWGFGLGLGFRRVGATVANSFVYHKNRTIVFYGILCCSSFYLLLLFTNRFSWFLESGDGD